MSDKQYTWCTGRRKSATARVRVIRGSGKIIVNDKPYEKYFSTEHERGIAIAPLNVTKTLAKYDVIATVSGGGLSGQAGAVRLGIARALKILEPPLFPKLKEEGFLTRDPRMKERKKYGLRGARRGVQYSKR